MPEDRDSHEVGRAGPAPPGPPGSVPGDDLADLLNGTGLALVSLDDQLRINRYTPPATQFFDLRPADIGRPVGDITPTFPDGTFRQDLESVFRTSVPREKRVDTPDGKSWCRRITPHRTVDHRTEGVVLTFTDVTGILRADAQARRLVACLGESNDALIVHDGDGKIIAWNRGAESMTGYTEAEGLGMSFDQLIPEGGRDRERARWGRILRGERGETWRSKRRTKEGRLLDVLVTCTAVRDEAGGPVALLNAERDVSEYLKIQTGLQDQADRLRLALSAGQMGTWDWDMLTGRVSWDARLSELFGLHPEPRELLASEGFQFLHPDDWAHIEAGIVRSREQGCPFREEFRAIHPDGSVFWLRGLGHPQTNPQGEVVRLTGVTHDVTESKNAEEVLRRLNASLETQVAERTRAVREQGERFRTILITAADAIITIDTRGRIETVNPAAERLFGYAAAEMIGENVKMLMPPPDRDRHDDYLERYQQTRVARMIGTGRQVVAQRKDGSTFPAELAVSEVDHLNLFTGIIRDVSKVRELEREVVEVASLEQRRIGQDLHDSVAQELTALSLMADDLTYALQEESSPSARLAGRIVEGLGRSQRELRAVMRGLLPVAVDSRGLMAALADLADRVLEEGKVSCAFECPDPVSVRDNLTATHLYLIAHEAVLNAVKHAQPQAILISLTADGPLTLTVRDDGCGLPEPPHVENRGLGLRIMQNRAAIIGASLTIQRAGPVGTLVTCTLPRSDL